jgi:hypothetical protein
MYLVENPVHPSRIPTFNTAGPPEDCVSFPPPAKREDTASSKRTGPNTDFFIKNLQNETNMASISLVYMCVNIYFYFF